MGGKLLRKINYDEVRSYISNTSEKTSIYIGVDSRNVGAYTYFVTVIVVHIDSSHGAHLFVEIEQQPRLNSLTQRLMEEVYRAVFCALNIVEAVGNRKMEIHLDINPSPSYKSSKIYNVAKGYVSAQGFKAIFKPEAFAATSVANYIAHEL